MQGAEGGARLAELSRAKVLAHRYSIGLTRVAADSLGPALAGNRVIQTILTIDREPGLTPSKVAERTGMSRPAVARMIRRLHGDLLVERTRAEDGRSARLTTTSRGRRVIGSFEVSIAAYFTSNTQIAREVVELLGTSDPGKAGMLESPLAVAERLAIVGAEYGDEVGDLFVGDGTLPNDRIALSFLHESGPRRPVELARWLDLGSATMTESIDRLVAAGLVRRSRPEDLDDRRGVLIALTPEGVQGALAMLPILEHHAPAIGDALAMTMRFTCADEALNDGTARGA